MLLLFETAAVTQMRPKEAVAVACLVYPHELQGTHVSGTAVPAAGIFWSKQSRAKLCVSIHPVKEPYEILFRT